MSRYSWSGLKDWADVWRYAREGRGRMIRLSTLIAVVLLVLGAVSAEVVVLV